MKLEGIHHITAITADAPGNVEFYAGTLGLKLVKKSVNQDDPTVYHLFYADDLGSPGADLTFFEYPGVPNGRAGAGMVHRIVWRVASEEALDFWEKRIEAAGVIGARAESSLRFRDPEGLALEIRVVETNEQPLVADHPEVPKELALQGFHEVRAYSSAPELSERFLREGLGFTPTSDVSWKSEGDDRSSFYVYDEAPGPRGMSGAGTVHHVAWASTMEDHETWRERVAATGGQVTPIIDRLWFRSIYFREPSGVLFEIATLGPGFTADESLETLGQRLSLPPSFEPLREKLEGLLKPLPDPWSKTVAP